MPVSAGGGGGKAEGERTGKIEGEGRGWERKGESEEFPNERRGFSFNAIKVFHLTASPADSSTLGATSLKSMRPSLCVLLCV